MGGGAYTTTTALPVGPSILPLGDAIPVDWRVVSPGYFRTMEIPLLRGRYFNEQDDLNAPPVMMISQATARRFWAASDRYFELISISGARRKAAAEFSCSLGLKCLVIPRLEVYHPGAIEPSFGRNDAIGAQPIFLGRTQKDSPKKPAKFFVEKVVPRETIVLVIPRDTIAHSFGLLEASNEIAPSSRQS